MVGRLNRYPSGSPAYQMSHLGVSLKMRSVQPGFSCHQQAQPHHVVWRFVIGWKVLCRRSPWFRHCYNLLVRRLTQRIDVVLRCAACLL